MSSARLTEREDQVLGLLALGYGNKEVARRLEVSVRTVETHRLNLRRKTRTGRLAELVVLAQERGLVAAREDVEPRQAEPSQAEPSQVEPLLERIADLEREVGILRRDRDRLDALDALRGRRGWVVHQDGLHLVTAPASRPLRWVLDDWTSSGRRLASAESPDKPRSRDEADRAGGAELWRDG